MAARYIALTSALWSQHRPARRPQTGIALTELVFVTSLIALLLAAALPSFEDLQLRGQLRSGQATVVQSLAEARQLARSHGTIVTVRIDGAKIVTTRADDDEFSKTADLPRRVQATAVAEFVFQPIGTVTADQTTIVLGPTKNSTSNLSKAISVSPLGVISSS